MAASAPAENNAFTSDAVQYGPAPSLVAPGAQLAVLEGNPLAASGDYTVRLKALASQARECRSDPRDLEGWDGRPLS